ncbi:MAG: MipA/OmpV family protein [Deltaproteobacteria bacterium]|jgi:outer membrane scaffolding protein for murein synthesis (MipA/OmpV family)|nr:MipA/OmpV family protein [Deltaproteobacteria bacterium]
MSGRLLTIVFALLFLAGSSALALAQIDDYGSWVGTPIEGSIGIGAVYAPDYDGADSSGYHALPILNLRYGPVFLSSDKGLGVSFAFFDGALELSPAVGYRFRRDEDDSPVLNGMGDASGQVTLGGSALYHFTDTVSFGAKAFQGLSSDKGFAMDLRAAYQNRAYERLTWSVAATTSLADQKYHQTYFGVTPTQSARSGHKVYSPSAGFKDVGLGGSVDFFLTPSFSVDVFARYRYLIGDAGDSPLVKAGSQNQFSTGLLFFFHIGGY